MGRGICPTCGSGNVSRESGRHGHTGDWKCDHCGYSNTPEAFKPLDKKDEPSDKES